MKKNIIIEGHENDWYEKAIFVLKESHTTQKPQDLVAYAENLLESKLKKGEYTSPNVNLEKYAIYNKPSIEKAKAKQWHWIDDFFGVSLGILGISIIFYVLF